MVSVSAQDRNDFLRLMAHIERLQPRDGAQTAARRELLAKLQRYDLGQTGSGAASSAACSAAQRAPDSAASYALA